MKTTNAIAMKVINFQNLIVTMMWIMLGKRQNTGVFHTVITLFLLIILPPLHLRASTLSSTLQELDARKQSAEQWIWHNPMAELSADDHDPMAELEEANPCS